MEKIWYLQDVDGLDVEGDKMLFFDPKKRGYELSLPLEVIPELSYWMGKRQDFYPKYVLGWEFERDEFCKRFPCPDPLEKGASLYHPTRNLVAYYIEPYRGKKFNKEFPYMKEWPPYAMPCGDSNWRIVLLTNNTEGELESARQMDEKYWIAIGKLLDIEEPPKWYIDHWTGEQRMKSIEYLVYVESGEEDSDTTDHTGSDDPSDECTDSDGPL